MIPQTEADLLRLISDKIEESLSLDYKRAEALIAVKVKGDTTKEVTKDVSAFANSAGGMIIYGISEGSDSTKHLPVSLSPIDRTIFSKERLEHLINNIQPRIPGIEITPVPLSSGDSHVAYVVFIPPSTTAHQCTDKRYYRRHNFEAVMMEDYEIRDVMNRNRFPALSIEVILRLKLSDSQELYPLMPAVGVKNNALLQNFRWILKVKNYGGTVGHYLEESAEIPRVYLKGHDTSRSDLVNFKITNFLRTRYGSGTNTIATEPEYKRVLPKCDLEVLNERESAAALHIHQQPFSILWHLCCDDAPPREGVVRANDVIVEVNSSFEEEMARKSVHLEKLNFSKITRI